MNFKTTAILLIVLIAAGVALFLTRDTGTKTETATPETGKKLLSFSPSNVSSLSIEPAGAKAIVLKRDGMNWRMLQPVQAPAESSIPTEILSELSNLQSTGRVSTAGPDAA